MAKPRTPTNVLALKGAFDKDPARGRARAAEPQPEGEIGDPPEYLNDHEQACWHEIVSVCHRGTLCAGDRLAMEHAARILSGLRRQEEYVDTKLMMRWESIMGRFGLTPADRSRVSVTKGNASTSPLDEFAA